MDSRKIPDSVLREMLEEIPDLSVARAIVDELLAGRKIEAIKLFRETTGQGLKESKERLESLVAKWSRNYPELQRASGGGCSLGLLLVTGCLGFLWAVLR